MLEGKKKVQLLSTSYIRNDWSFDALSISSEMNGNVIEIADVFNFLFVLLI